MWLNIAKIFLIVANFKNSHGQYTEENVSRCSKIVWSVGKAIEKIFEADFIKDYIPHTSASDGSSKAKLKKFIEEYMEWRIYLWRQAMRDANTTQVSINSNMNLLWKNDYIHLFFKIFRNG